MRAVTLSLSLILCAASCVFAYSRRITRVITLADIVDELRNAKRIEVSHYRPSSEVYSAKTENSAEKAAIATLFKSASRLKKQLWPNGCFDVPSVTKIEIIPDSGTSFDLSIFGGNWLRVECPYSGQKLEGFFSSNDAERLMTFLRNLCGAPESDRWYR